MIADELVDFPWLPNPEELERSNGWKPNGEIGRLGTVQQGRAIFESDRAAFVTVLREFEPG